MAVGRRDVEHIAQLARLSITGDELSAFTDEMNAILAFFERLGDVNTDGVEPAFRVLRRTSVFRKDEPDEMLSTGEALANAPESDGDCFRVPAFLPADTRDETNGA